MKQKTTAKLWKKSNETGKTMKTMLEIEWKKQQQNCENIA